MGHLKGKYSDDYFLGGTVDPVSGKEFSVLGHSEFREGKAHERTLLDFEFARSLADPLAGKNILEIGFGRGDYIPLFLKEDVAGYTGIDFSESALRIAREHFKDPRIKLLQSEATKLDEEQAFDLIVLFDVLEHIPVFEMETVWRKIGQSLTPGGHIVISTPIFDNPNTTDHSDEISPVMGMHCNKQTLGTLLCESLKNGFTVVRNEERIFGLVRTKDLDLFSDETKRAYLEAESELLKILGVSDFDGKLTPSVEHMLTGKAGRIAIGCAADNNDKFLSQALRLLQSLRWFGGEMAGANFFLCAIDNLAPEYEREFERLGAFVRVAERFSDLHPHSNKLRLLELPEIAFYDTFILLDCDTVVTQDPWPFLDGIAFQAKIADLPTVSNDVFKNLFQHFNLGMPEQNYKTNPSELPTVWFCNAGVLVFPGETVKSLGAAWRKYNLELLKSFDLLDAYTTYCDQASLSLAFASQPVPFNELPLSMNFPLHLTHLSELQIMNECDPVILHYHDLVDAEGYLKPSSYPGAQKRIEQFNERLKEERHQRSNRQEQDKTVPLSSGGVIKHVKKLLEEIISSFRKN